jgi:hypothetical protein
MRIAKTKEEKDCSWRTGRKMLYRHEAGKGLGFLSVAAFVYIGMTVLD